MKLSNTVNNFGGLLYFRGRVALYALLKGMGIGKGDEVALQAFTCVANPEAIMAAGAIPVFVDIEESGVNMDSADLERKISPKTKALVVQHTFGIPADLDAVLQVAEKYNLSVIEDCCHTLVSQYDGKTLGSFGIGSYYSFEWGKPVVAGIGGALKINDNALMQKVESQYHSFGAPPHKDELRLRAQYMAHKILYRPALFWPLRSLFHTLGKIGAAASNYNPMEEGKVASDFSWRMFQFSQNNLLRKIAKIDSMSKDSSIISGRYAESIGAAGVKHVVVPDKSLPVYCRYPLLTDDKKNLLRQAKDKNVEMAEWYATPVHPLLGDELKLVNYHSGCCPNAEKRCSQIVTLPTHTAVKDHDVKKIVRFFATLNMANGVGQ